MTTTKTNDAVSSFPFSSIVVTTPDASAAQAAREGPLETIRNVLVTATSDDAAVEIRSTYDPFESRCGSGGGTLAALSTTTQTTTKTTNGGSVLIIHAGGDSSRCPTQMALGKSWTSLPTATTAASGGSISNPTSILVQTLQNVFSELPPNSVVVAASDTILQLTLEGNDQQQQHQQQLLEWNDVADKECVFGVAVPAPFETAKNHGVFVLGNTDGNNKSLIQPVQEFLQKPSIPTLQHHFSKDQHPQQHYQQQQRNMAWIDTGVVVFPPKAAQRLRSLSQGVLAHCTEQGLEASYNQSATTAAASSSMTLQEYAHANALKVDLYTHFMLALTTPTSMTKQEYCQAFVNELPKNVLEGIHDALSPLSLHTLVLPKGSFLHLGTSAELVDFLVHSPNLPIGRALGLIPRHHNLLLPSLSNVSTSSVMTNSLFLLQQQENPHQLQIGDKTAIEHCHVTSESSPIQIGSHCLVSGWRSTYRSSSKPIIIPDKTVLQMLPLDTSGKHVCIYLGLNDDIKEWNVLYGKDANSVGLKDEDLWDADEEKKLLWTARLHPILEGPQVDINELFGWIHDNDHDDGKKGPPQAFLSTPRLSLKEIRQRTDALAEWRYRRDLETEQIPTAIQQHLHRIQVRLLEREPTECQLNCGVARNVVVDSMKKVMEKALEERKYDVCGRAFMVLSTLLDELSEALHDKDDKVDGMESSVAAEALECLRMKSDGEQHRQTSHTLLDLVSNAANRPKELSVAMERAAHALTELCVCHGHHEKVWSRVSPSPVHQWVMATAPGRIDLSGGWSDTPPICYEHGGAVCGLAVLVDGCKPLSCMTRTIAGGKGIRLQTESRDIRTGEILSKTTLQMDKVGSLRDFRDPLSDCALLKCALVYLGLLPHDDNNDNKTAPEVLLQPYLNRFCQSGENDVGLEIRSISMLPHGSGMGTSSILGGCVLASIAKCVGVDTGDDLVSCVLELEQLMTTGGGWQDQIGGLMGGAKLGRSAVHKFAPIDLSIQQVSLSDDTIDALNRRLVLAFTGKTRLAKNLLQNVLRRWARRTGEIVSTVKDLVSDAETAATALEKGDLATLAACINRYWQQKKVMAGEGAEPGVVKAVLEKLFDRKLISAATLCGAGGGGFMALMLADGYSVDEITASCREGSFVWHECTVSKEGLEVFTLDDVKEQDGFEMSWIRRDPVPRKKRRLQ